MKTLIFFLSLHFVKPDSVYLCLGPKSHAYHCITYCKGLKTCSTKLIKVSLNDAIYKYHRTSCAIVIDNSLLVLSHII